MNEIYLYVTYAILALAIGVSLKAQRLIDLSPALALMAALASNYINDGLAGASIMEIFARILVAYIVLRCTAEFAKRLTNPLPLQMRYATQQPVIEFEEVE